MSLFLPSWLALARSAAIAATLMLTTASVCRAQSTPAAQFSCDFRQNRFDNLSLVAVGTGAINLLKPSGDGIRLTIPSGKNMKAIGFAPRFQIHGNFEIEMECLILNRSRPKSGFGSGPSIYLSMGSADDPAASLGRQLRPDGRDVYGVFAATKTEKGRTPTARLIDAPPDSDTRPIRLNLRRTGDKVTYSVAEDRDTELRELATLPVSDSDVSFVRLGAAQSDEASTVSMVIRSIRIAAEELPHLPSAQERTGQYFRPGYQPAPHRSSVRWIWQTAAAVALVAGFAVWIHRRRSQ